MARAGRRTTSAADASARSALYQFLAEATSYPTRDGVELLRGPLLGAALRVSTRIDAATRSAFAPLRRALRDLDHEQAERAYVAAFGHGAPTRVVPYECPYVATNLFQEADLLGDVAGFYRAFGVQPAAARPERPDHVALELEFMYLLTTKEAHARTSGGPEQVAVCEDAQRSFLAAHLGRWAVAFFRSLRAASDGTRYGAVAAAGEAFLTLEAARAGAVPVGRDPERAPHDLPGEGWCPLPLEVTP